MIYYWKRPDRLYLLFMYPKNTRADLTPQQLKSLRALVMDQDDSGEWHAQGSV